MSSTVPIIQRGLWSIRCYRLLMKLYPPGFLAEFGDSIDQAFRDSLRDVFQKRGYPGIALLWFRIIPDFVFSVVELLTSTAGDYLKFYFRLRWILACGFAFAVGDLVVLILINSGQWDALGLPRRWGLLGLPLWLSLGFFQSRVLTTRFSHPLRWTVFTTVGGVLGIYASQALVKLSPIPLVFNPHRWESWLLQLLVAGTAALTGLLVGWFQWTALKRSGSGQVRWAGACALGAYASALVSVSSAALGVPNWPFLTAVGYGFFGLLRSFVVGAALGTITAGPLKRMLWHRPPELAHAQLPEQT